MGKPKTVTRPTKPGQLIAEPQTVLLAFDQLNGLLTLTVQIVVPDGNSTLAAGKASLTGDGPDNILLNLPLKFKTKVLSPSGGATQDTELRAKFAELLLRLTETGQNPG